MNKMFFGVVCVAVMFVLGCASSMKHSGALGVALPEQTDRMLIWRGSMELEVGDVKETGQKLDVLVKAEQGYVERNDDYGEKQMVMTVRIPADKLKATMQKIEELGSVTSRSLSSEDVTEEYIDVEARLKNMILLRDRLQKLLDKADKVQDILAIEKELARIQGNIDSMQGRIKSLKMRVKYAELTVTLNQRQILGPLGYLFKGIAWGLGKLFVIQ